MVDFKNVLEYYNVIEIKRREKNEEFKKEQKRFYFD